MPHRPEADRRTTVPPRLLQTGQEIVHAFGAFGLVEVILFGSWVGGQPGPGSDVDYLLITNRELTPGDVERLAAPLANDLENDFGHLPEIHTTTPDEVRGRLGLDDSWLRMAISDGIVLYPPERHRSEFDE